MDYRGLWQSVLGEIEIKISHAKFETWFKHTSIIANENGHIVVAVPNVFNKAWLEKEYHTDIQEALGRIIGGVASVEYKVETPGSQAKKTTDLVEQLPQPSPGAAVAKAAAPQTSALNARYMFDNFVVGSSNDLAYAAARAVVKNPGTKYNPLFIYGGAGLGKTHLIQAIGNEILSKDPSRKIEYVTSESFTNEFISAIMSKKNQSFTDKYRKVDVLIVDDIQFLSGKEKTHDEFFHTFNALHQANKQIIISSDKPPKAISGLSDRLVTRFAQGMTADIQAPDLETRSAILQSKAAVQGVILPAEVTDYLARNIRSNIRELEGALTKLLAGCELRDCDPTLADAGNVVSGISGSHARTKPLTARLVIEKTAAYFDLLTGDITGLKRDKEIVVPRQIAMYLMRHELGLSFPKIASVVGGRDHTTAMHSVAKIGKLLEVDEQMRNEVNAIREKLTV